MKSLVLLSGGIDSTVALAMTNADMAVSFDYGQSHTREIDAARQIAQHYGIQHITRFIELGACALTGFGAIPDSHAETPDATFVPGRNLVMIANATAIAQNYGYDTVVIGANADDRGGYPDCRPTFIHALDYACRTGYGVGIWSPLLRMSKRDIVAKAHELDVPLDLTWSCYRGGTEPCNKCGACESRNQAIYAEIGGFE